MSDAAAVVYIQNLTLECKFIIRTEYVNNVSTVVARFSSVLIDFRAKIVCVNSIWRDLGAGMLAILIKRPLTPPPTLGMNADDAWNFMYISVRFFYFITTKTSLV